MLIKPKDMLGVKSIMWRLVKQILCPLKGTIGIHHGAQPPGVHTCF